MRRLLTFPKYMAPKLATLVRQWTVEQEYEARMLAAGATKKQIMEVSDLATQIAIVTQHSRVDMLVKAMAIHKRYDMTWKQVIDHMSALLAIYQLRSHPGQEEEREPTKE